MGVDFIRKVSRTFEKHLDLARSELGTADLFTRTPIEDRPSFPVDVAPGVRLDTGQELTVEVSNETLVFRDVLSVVARADAPTAAVLEAINSSSGIATAIVQEMHDLSGVAEVTLC